MGDDAERLGFVANVTSAITSLDVPADAVTYALEALQARDGVDVAAFLERSDDANLAAAVVVGAAGLNGAGRLPILGSAEGLTFTSCETLVVHDLPEEGRFHPPRALVRAGVRGQVVAAVGRQPLGVISLCSREPGRFTDVHVDSLEIVATVLGAHLTELEAMHAVRDATSRIERLATHTSDVVFRYQLAPVRRIEYVSPAIESVFGRPRSVFLEHVDAWIGQVHPEDRARVEAQLGEGLAETPLRFRIRRSTGEIRHLEVVGSHLERSGDRIVLEGLARDISARLAIETAVRQSELERREASATASELHRLKTSFLQSMSHELRTPLTAILGYASTIAEYDAELDPAKRAAFLEPIMANARRLDALIADMLTVDRLDRDSLPIDPIQLDLAELVQDVVRAMDVGSHTVIADLSAAMVEADPAKVGRIVEALLGNATKHTPRGSTVWVTVRPHQGGALLTVEDDGPGIPDNRKEAVFASFNQGPDRPSHQPGVGLGLPLAHGLSRIHGGRCWVDDREGGGASFHAWLPAMPPQAAEAPWDPAADDALGHA